MTAPAAVVPLHRALGLTDDELAAIEQRLGRAPNDLELAMFSVMWSEHCSYKSSKPLLRTLPTGGGDVVAGPGENAGVVRIGDGLAVAFKLESHNHPSAVEPYQGAATGVGGILRDIFTMGARPIAVLDALERDGGVLFRYAREDGTPAEPDDPANPNGSLRAIAGVTNAAGNVAGLMPHPETAVEGLLGSDDGLAIIRSFVDSAARRAGSGARLAALAR